MIQGQYRGYFPIMKKLSLFVIPVFAAFSPFSCFADPDLPNFKLGEWEIKTYMEHLANPITITNCVTQESKQKLLEMSQQGHGRCTKPEMSHSGNTWTSKSVCAYQDKQVTTTLVMTLESETKYSSVVTTDNAEHPLTIKSEGVYKGECMNKDTQVEIAPGIKFDPKQLSNLAKSLHKNPQ